MDLRSVLCVEHIMLKYLLSKSYSKLDLIFMYLQKLKKKQN